MIWELVEFGRRIRIDTGNVEDSLDFETANILIKISNEGEFINIYAIEKNTIVEDVIRAEDKGRTSGIVPRLLVDNSQYVLGFPHENKRSLKCLKEFKNKISLYADVKAISPVLKFYENQKDGVLNAYKAFALKVKNKELDARGNIAFLVENSENLINEDEEIKDAIIKKYFKDEKSRNVENNYFCTICGKNDYRSKSVSVHGVIKKIPSGQSAGCSLISYNADSFESYGFKGNDNSSICTHCIKNYVIGLNWLMTHGSEVLITDNKGKSKSQFIFSNRKNFGSDTAMIFWTRENEPLDELTMLDNPDPKQVSNLIDSVFRAKTNDSKHLSTNQFYSCTLSGAAARIAIRDWIEISLVEYKRNIAKWFEDIAIKAFGETRYAPLYALARAGHNSKSDSDPTNSRIAAHLWNAAIKGTTPPLWILTAVLKRIRFVETSDDGKSKDSITPERVAIIRLILNRNFNNGGNMIKEKSDPNDASPAIVCGKIFAVLEGIQRAAQGKDLNAGIRERFFSFASTSPAPAFGRLMKLSQNHISKLKHEKPGLAVVLDKHLQELCIKIDGFPTIFSLEEQGQFALGYYHQKQHDYDNAKSNKELQSIIENNKEE